MVRMLTEALRQIKDDWAHLLDAPAILAVCREVGYQWRDRVLDPVMTVHLFMLQILHGNTACSHLPHLAGTRFTAAAFCQARTRLPLVVWQQLVRQTGSPLGPDNPGRGAVAGPSHVPGGRLQFFDARYA